MAEIKIPHPERAAGAVEGRTAPLPARSVQAGEGSDHGERVGDVLEESTSRLARIGIDNARREARLLLNLALGMAASAMASPETLIARADAVRLAALV